MAAALLKPVKTTRKLTVANPTFRTDQPEGEANQRYIQAVISLRESSVITMAAHGVLDGNQVAAAWRFRRSYEMTVDVGSGSGQEERLPGSRRINDVAEKRLSAAGDIRIARRLLGAHGFNLVLLVCAEGFHVRDIFRSRRERDTATDMLRIHLSALAGVWHC